MGAEHPSLDFEVLRTAARRALADSSGRVGSIRGAAGEGRRVYRSREMMWLAVRIGRPFSSVPGSTAATRRGSWPESSAEK